MTHDVHKNIRAFHGSRGFQNLAGRVGSGRVGSGHYVSNLTGRVGSRGFKISRVGSGRVNRFPKSRGSGRVRSGRVGSDRVGARGFKISRAGSGHDPQDSGHSRVKSP